MGDGVETAFSILTFATYTNITESIWSTDILEELYHTVLPFSFTVNVCRNGILLAKPKLNSTQFQLKISLRLALFSDKSSQPATRPE